LRRLWGRYFGEERSRERQRKRERERERKRRQKNFISLLYLGETRFG